MFNANSSYFEYTIHENAHLSCSIPPPEQGPFALPALDHNRSRGTGWSQSGRPKSSTFQGKNLHFSLEESSFVCKRTYALRAGKQAQLQSGAVAHNLINPSFCNTEFSVFSINSSRFRIDSSLSSSLLV